MRFVYKLSAWNRFLNWIGTNAGGDIGHALWKWVNVRVNETSNFHFFSFVWMGRQSIILLVRPYFTQGMIYIMWVYVRFYGVLFCLFLFPFRQHISWLWVFIFLCMLSIQVLITPTSHIYLFTQKGSIRIHERYVYKFCGFFFVFTFSPHYLM